MPDGAQACPAAEQNSALLISGLQKLIFSANKDARGNMRSHGTLATSFFILLITTTALAQIEPSPATLSVQGSTSPFWISAQAARTPGGDVNYDLFAPGLKEVVRSQAIRRQINAAGTSGQPTDTGCGTFTLANTGGAAKAMATWTNNVQEADAIFVGIVTTVTPGFFRVSPATIVTVKIDRVLRANSAYPTQGIIFVPYFAADFQIGEERFCNAGLPRNGHSFLPAVNDRILVFAFNPPQGAYLPARDENLIFGRAGQAYLPLSFSRDSLTPNKLTFEQLINEAAHPEGGQRRLRDRGERP